MSALVQVDAVVLAGLARRYGALQALAPTDLAVRQGEFFSLLGPSGCGKTTLLRLLAGFTEPSAGTIHMAGIRVDSLPPERRDIGFVAQSYAIFPQMNVFENVAFGLRVRKLPNDQIRARVQASLAQVGLAGLDGRYERQLSGGQRQRVALARAIVVGPRLLLLDEPLSALDRRVREEMRVWLKHLQMTLGVTTIFVTHDQEEALAMSDRIAVMQAGHIEQVGTPAEIYERPATRFVAGFIGATNVLAGTAVAAPNGQWSVQCAATGPLTSAACEIPGAPRDGTPSAVDLLVRPENLLLAEPGANHGVIGLVVSAEYQGAQVLYHVEVQGMRMQSLVMNQASQARFAPGQHVAMSVQPGMARVLRKEAS